MSFRGHTSQASDDIFRSMKRYLVLSQISKWFLANKLIPNIEKASLVKSAPTKSSLYPLNLPYTGWILVELNNIKFLGPQLDSQCTWKMHINYLLNKLSVICFIVRRLVHILNIETLKAVYFAHFHSLIKFGIIIWGNSTTIHKVFVVQNHILRTVLGTGLNVFL